MKIHIQGKIREASDEEIAVIKAVQKEAELLEKAEADRAILKEATLAKLGLTADEVAALLS
jgi:hypothetical protein